jgi:uncharacterized protein DUF4352
MSLPPPGPPSDGQPGPAGGFGPPTSGGFGPPTGGGFGPPGYQPGAGPPIAPPGPFQPPPQTPVPLTSSGDRPPSNKGKFIIATIVIAALVGGGIAFAATRGGDDEGASNSDDGDEITIPDDITIPDEITIPDFSLPDFTLPDDVTIPDLTLPDDVTIPDFTLPDDVTIPDEITIPGDLTIPTFPSDVTMPDGAPTALGTAADMGSGFTVQVNSFNPDDTAALTASAATPQPADGNVYATVNVTISYDGDPGLGYVVVLDFTALRPPDVSASWYSTMFLVNPPDALDLTTELQPGDSATGTIVFEVPSDATSELTLVASSLLPSDESGVAFALH